jgi:hypothetical protein
MTKRTALLASVALLWPHLAFAQEVAPPAPVEAAPGTETPAQPTEPTATAVDIDEEGETVVVTGQKPRGSVVGDIPAENVLGPRDIRATGATSISELLDSIASKTGSARGRGGERPILLLNGQRISGFRELRDLPPEAIERMEILPEEVALKYGYSADQKVVNIVLRRRFNSTTAEVGGTIATEGGYAAGKVDATKLLISNGKRNSLNVHIEGNNPLYESERDIGFDAANGADPRDFRTLTGASQSARVTGTMNRTVFGDVGATVTAEAGRTKNRSRFGISPFEPLDPLTRNSTTDSAGLGLALNTQKGKWRLSSTVNAQLDRSESDADRNLISSLTDDESRSTRTSFSIDGTANGPLFALPAGDANVTFKAGASRLDLDGEARRRDLVNDTDLGRTQFDGSASLDLPLAKRASSIGRLSANLNAGLSQVSDFGTLTSVGAGLNWAPAPRINLLTSVTREEGAPTLQQLGDPLLSTANVPYFDAVRGESVNVTTTTGGNPALDADRRTVWKLGGNWQPKEDLDLRLRADFVHQTIDRPQIGFPAATPALQAAFPDRFQRDGTGQLVSVDLRPVNADRSTRDTLRIGFDFTKPLKSAPPSPAAIAALRARFAGNRANAQGAGQSPSQQGGTQSATASGQPQVRFGGRGGGRQGGRLTFSLADNITLVDKLKIAEGIPELDYLNGEASGSNGGRPRHQVEAEAGYYNNGLGARLSANWRSATEVIGGATGQNLRFGDYASFDLRLFANLGERFDLVSKHPFFIGSSLRFEVKNIFDAKPSVRGGDGAIPFAYYPDRLEPIGRTVGITFRKQFLPTRFLRFGGGGGPGGRGGAGGPPPR